MLQSIDASIHVRSIVSMDAESPFVTAKEAPGVKANRERIKAAFKGQ